MSEPGLTSAEVVELLEERDNATHPKPVGFVGLGQIGAPMAAHLVDWPGGLVVYDVAPKACAKLVSKGAEQADSVADLASRASVISVMVRDDTQVWDVLEQALTTAEPGTVVAVHSTIALDTAVALHQAAAARGVALVDAPVSGGFMGAHEGNLAVLVGGDADAVERCMEPFQLWAGLVSHLGPIGAGTKAKLARNLLHFAAFTAVGEAQRLAQAAGIDLVELGRIVRHTDAITGGPGAIMIRDTSAPIPEGDPLRDIFEHTRSLGEKDLRLALELGESLGIALPMGAFALDHLGAALGVPDPSPAEPPAAEPTTARGEDS